MRNGNGLSSLLYFLIYCPLGALCPLIGQYLNYIGFSGTEVGIITSTGTAVSVVAGMFWGNVYSNTNHKRRVIAIMFLSAATFALISLSTKVFIIYVAIFGAMYFFQGPVYAACDSMVISNGKIFPLVRSFGAVGYAVSVYFTGTYAQNHGLETIFYVYAAAYVVAIFVLFREKEPQSYKQKGEKIRLKELLGNKRFIKLMICAFFVMGTNVGNNTYFGYLFTEGGGDIAGIGTAFLLMAGSEAPFMILIPLINKRIPSEKLILIPMLFCVLRFSLYATGPSWQMLLGTFFLQGITNGILLVEMVKLIGLSVEERLSSMAVSVYYALGNSLSAIICQLVGGVILDYFNAQGVYAFFAGINGVALVLYLLLGLYKKEKADSQKC